MRMESARTKEGFLKRLAIKGPNDCWEWTMGRQGSGVLDSYGIVWIDGKRWKAHRYAFTLFVRPLLSPRELVCHTCDNPPCCNPAHLFAGTHKDNTLDSIAKGRFVTEQGEDRYNAKLTEEDVREIRASYSPRKVGIDQLAARFGVGRTMIFAIVKRRRWKHVA